MKSQISVLTHNSTKLNHGLHSRLGLVAALFAVAPACLGQDARVTQPIAASIVDAASLPASMGSISRVPGKTLHVVVGHSVFVDTKTRLRRVYVTDPTILNSVTLSPNQIIVTAMNPGLSSLTLLDETGRAQSYLVSSDVDVDGLRAAMSEALRNDSVKIDGTGGRVTLTGTVGSSAIADSAAKLAALYAKEVSNALVVAPGHPKQVRLEVRILEVDRAKALQLGINLFQPGGTGWVATSTSAQFPSTATLSQAVTGAAASSVAVSNPLSFFLYNFQHNIGATIQDLQSKQVLQILAEPNITTISGEKANFLAGGEFPFPIVQPGGTGSSPVVTISFRPYGVRVEFTPIVNEDGTIRLKVMPEVSALDFTNAVTISGFTVPAISTRKAETEVELRSNQSFAISGLLDQRTTDIMSKNPGAASIPILGNFFKSKTANRSTTELIVVVTPTVVDPLTDTTVPVQPEMPIRTLDTGGFDKSLGRNLNPKPAAPPLDPDHPHFGNQAPAPAPAATSTPVTVPPAGSASPSPVTKAPNPSAAAAHSAPAANPGPDPAVGAMPAPGSRDQILRGSTSNRGRQRAELASASMVEVMAVPKASDADAMVVALRRQGYDVAVNRLPEDSLLHLEVGPFASKQHAEAMRQRLLLDGYNATMK